MGGTGKPKTGGRKKGTPNRLTASAAETFGKLNFDPIRKLVGIARQYERILREMDKRERETPGYKLDNWEIYQTCLDKLVPIYDKLAPYAYPKRKAVELSADDDLLEVIHHWGAPPPELETDPDGEC